MTNADIRAGYDSLNSMEDAYALAKEGGYAGTMEDFELLCALATEDMLQMNLDDISDYAEHACRAPRS